MKTQFGSFGLACLLSLCITATAWGDDLEIYLGTNQTETVYLPNVLFIMDSSGSMSGKDGGTESRLLRVQNALTGVLATATNVNVGLMRFSNRGGPILYPVSYIDQVIDAQQTYSITASNNDAHEINGVVTTDSEALTLTSGTDDVTAGLRFEDVLIPQGAQINSAYIRLFSAGLETTDAGMNIFGELAENSAEFEASSNDLSSRTKTAISVEWDSDHSFPISDSSLVTPDISAVIQEVVDQSVWCGGNALSVLFTSLEDELSSLKKVLSVDSGGGLTPQLVVDYDNSSAAGCIASEDIYQVASQNDNVEEKSDGTNATGNVLNFKGNENDYVAVRFTNATIPQGATIETAKLVFTASSDSNNGNASMTINAVAEDNPEDFSDYVNYHIRDAAKTSASVSMSFPAQTDDEENNSPELKSIVQEIVDRAGWVSGNSIVFVMSDFSGSRTAHSYNGSAANAVKFEVSYTGNATPGQSQTVRNFVSSLVNELSADGTTPIVDTLYEASLYYAGMDVNFGLTRGDSSTSSSVRRSTRVSHELSYIGEPAVRPSGCSENNLSASECEEEYIPAGATYISPIENLQCQTNNHIVLLSDGAAVGNQSAGLIKAQLGIDSCSDSGSEECGVDLVSNISDADESFVGTAVTTHTIGFAANDDVNNYLNRLANEGGGSFYTADNSESLIDVFNSILQSVKDVRATFVSPGVAVNQLNQLTHRDEVYYAVFQPEEGAVWPGNLKRYSIEGSTLIDVNGLEAIDASTGFFKDGTQSYWSLFADGPNVSEGGASSLLGTTRNLYVINDEATIVSANNALSEDNNEITEAMLGVDSESNASALRDAILKWARGIDVKDEDGDGDTTDSREAIGDPIHSQPAVVDYSSSNSTNVDTSIYVATNQGFLHSFDAETGEENFAVIPQELLSNLHEFYEDQSTINHTYGLDGDLVLRTTDTHKYLYIGMRRGGSSYYALDITDKDTPKLLFSVGSNDSGLEQMGQTWSRPIITKIKFGNTDKDVMIVGGGYDENQDDKSLRSADTVGNTVYIFDADDGSLLWSAGNAESNDLFLEDMQYSIPGRVSVIDRDGDGYANHMYVADMGGQLFRFDIYNGETGDDLIKGARIADFGGDTASENRRFYYGPDIAQVAIGTDLYYAVAIGSGKRASPLDTTINDRFYMLKDESVFTITEEGEFAFPDVATESSLYDATEGLLASTESSVIEAESSDFASKMGWMLRLVTGGEKVLASPTIIDHSIFFTTYIPAESNPSLCAPASGSNRAYLVNLVNGNAVPIVNNESENVDNRYQTTDVEGIAPPATFIVGDDGSITACIGTICARTQPEYDDTGTQVACTDSFECLSENIFKDRERVRKDSWKTETESQ